MLTKLNQVDTGKIWNLYKVDMRRLFYIIGIIFIAQLIIAQNVEVESYVDRTKIGTSDLVKYTIEISGEKVGNISTPRLPNLENFENLGSSTSSSSNYSFVNGKMTSKVTKSYTYSLRPKKIGNHLIHQ